MGATDSLDKAEKASNFLTGLLTAAKAHPYVFLFVMAAIAFVVAFLPNGPVKAYIEYRGEMKKLHARTTEGKRRLSNARQNRSGRRKGG